jgi:hypothetical protein
MLKEVGLNLVGRLTSGGGGHIVAEVQAPNGAKRKITFTRSPSDWRGDKNMTGDLRRFARENPKVEDSTVGEALEVAGLKSKGEYKFVKQSQPPSAPSAPPPPRPLSPTPPPRIEVPIMATASVAPAPVTTIHSPVLDTKKDSMSTKTASAPAPTPSPDTTKATHRKGAPGARTEINRLDTFQSVDLANYLRDKYDWTGLKPRVWDDVAKAASEALGFSVTIHNVTKMASHYKLALYTPPKMPDDPIAVLARHIKKLYDELGHPVDDDFQQLLQAQGQLAV